MSCENKRGWEKREGERRSELLGGSGRKGRRMLGMKKRRKTDERQEMKDKSGRKTLAK